MHASAARVDMHRKLLAAFGSVVRHHGKISDVVRSDVVLACEVFNDKRQRMTSFAFLTAPSYRSGVRKADQVFVEAGPVDVADARRLHPGVTGEDRFTGLVLQLRTLPFHEMKKHWLPPQQQQQRGHPLAVGRLVMFMADEYAKDLLDMDGAADSDRSVSAVVITKLTYEDLWPCRVRISGVDRGMQPLVVQASTGLSGRMEGDAAVGDADVEEAGDVSDPEPAIDVGHELETDDVDLLALLSQGGLPAQSRPRRPARSARVPQASEEDTEVAEDLLADPEVRAMLGSHELESLRAALKVCQAAALRLEIPQTSAGAGSDDDESEIEDESELPPPPPAEAAAPTRLRRRKRRRRVGEEIDAESEHSDTFLRPPAPVPVQPAQAPQAHASSSSAAAPAPGPRREVLRLEPDGSRIRVVYESRGLEICRVEHVKPEAQEIEVLGVIKQMTRASTGVDTLQAVCRRHSSCICWMSNTQHLDLLLDWLASASSEDYASHQAMAVQLKTSVGMKVRGAR